MAIRLDKAILRGEISNEVRGLVTGLIWVVDQDDPIVLRLEGNCLRDLAGCTVQFVNPQPESEEMTEVLHPHQEGVVGDMTASRRTRIPTVDGEELQRLLQDKEPVPSVTANALYLEWFSSDNGRVVVETCHCKISVSEPVWSMTAEEEKQQEEASQQNFYAFLDTIMGGSDTTDEQDVDATSGAFTDDPFIEFSADDVAGEPFAGDGAFDWLEDSEEEDRAEPEEEDLFETALERFAELTEEGFQPLDEFEWEQELREADRKAAAYQEALEKHKDSPDRDKLIAEAMGWDSEDEDPDFDWERIEFGPLFHNDSGNFTDSGFPPPFDEEQRHPLSKRVTDLALQLQHDAEARGIIIVEKSGEQQNLANPYLTVVMHIISLGGKLAAALDGSVQGVESETGFVVAMLKRAQIPLNEALSAIGSLCKDHLDENTAEWLEFARTELFDLRNEVLELMHELRSRPK